MEGCDDQESVCSSNEREIDAFPKAFERELVTPTNLNRTQEQQLSTESCGSIDRPDSMLMNTSTKDDKNITENKTDDKQEENVNDLLKEMKSLEERRKSLLDHHWAVPSKDRYFFG